MATFKKELFDAAAIERTIKRISHEILEKNDDVDSICLVGIKTRGVPIAKRIAKCIEQIENRRVAVGTLDITLYRDDIVHTGQRSADLEFDITGKNVILVDDVIYTGRTVRAALDAIMANGRAAKIQLAALIDRGHRELPIRADYVGKNIPTSKIEIVKVSLLETDSVDKVDLLQEEIYE